MKNEYVSKLLDEINSKVNGAESSFDFGELEGLRKALEIVSGEDTSEIKKYIDKQYLKFVNNGS